MVRINFYNLTSITESDVNAKLNGIARNDVSCIQFPSNVFSVGTSAFHDFTSLNTIYNLNNIENVGDYAFINSTLTGNLTMNQARNVSIGKYAFKNTNLTRAIIDAVQIVGEGAFENCSELTSININKKGALSSVNNNTFKDCIKLTTIYNDLRQVKYFGDSAFENCPLSCVGLYKANLTLNTANNEYIGKNAFKGAKIQRAILDGSISSIGEYAFSDCSELTSINFSKSIDVEVFDYAFKNCNKLLTCWNTSHLTYIGINAFEDTNYWNVSPSELHLSSGMQKIVKSGTEDDPQVIKYYNPDTYVDPDTILDFTSLDHSNLEMKDVNNYLELSGFGRQSEFAVYTGTSVTSVGDNAFIGCKKIGKVVASNAKKFGKSSFKGCDSLSAIQLNDDGTDQIGVNSFADCSSLTEIENLDKVLSVLDGAFQNCTALTSVNLSNATYIGVNAFAGCTSLSAVEVGNATTICDGAFNYNTEGTYTITVTK